MALGRMDDAAVRFEALIENGNGSKQTYYFLGETYSKLKRDAESHYNLGIYHYKKGDLRNARFHLLRAKRELNDPAKRKTADDLLKRIEKRRRKAAEQEQ